MTAYVDIKALSALGCSEVRLRSASGECFPGQYEDGESGLSYNYFRDFDPTLGRYIQSDPIGSGGGPNTFLYAVGKPLLLTDLKGLIGTYVAAVGQVTAPGATGSVGVVTIFNFELFDVQELILSFRNVIAGTSECN